MMILVVSWVSVGDSIVTDLEIQNRVICSGIAVMVCTIGGVGSGCNSVRIIKSLVSGDGNDSGGDGGGCS